MPSYGALTLFFRWRKKSVQKKASGTATPEAARPASRRGLRSAGALRAVLDLGSLRSPAGKKALIAHFDGGARNVARNLVGQLTPSPVRAPVLTFFRRQNERAFFPSLPIAALLPRSWRGADSTNASWDVTAQVGWLRCIHKQTCFPTHSWRWAYLINAAWDASVRLEWFRSAEKQACFFLLPLALYLLNQRRLG